MMKFPATTDIQAGGITIPAGAEIALVSLGETFAIGREKNRRLVAVDALIKYEGRVHRISPRALFTDDEWDLVTD